MYHKIKTYMEEHGMIEAGDMVCAGVSGGGDSMAMLSALKRYQEEIPFSLCAVHVNHGIRGEEAMRDENLVKDICENKVIKSFIYTEENDLKPFIKYLLKHKMYRTVLFLKKVQALIKRS